MSEQHQSRDQQVIWTPWPSVEQARDVLGTRPGVTYLPWVEVEEFPGDPASASLVVLPYARNPQPFFDRIDEFTSLQVIQAQMAGTDHIDHLVPEGITLCNAAGVHDAATAEIAVALCLATGRHLDEFARDQVCGQWNPRWGTGLANRRVLIFGYGHIGKAIERRICGFEPASITRVATRARSENVGGTLVEVHPAEELPELLTRADVVFIIAPLTEQTRGLFDADMLARMPEGAVLVNVGRGPIVDTQALVEACASRRLRAGLDVIDPEPVPADHPLRTTPGIFFSPHVGGLSNAFAPRRDALLAAQVTRFLAGDPLDNVVIGPRTPRPPAQRQ